MNTLPYPQFEALRLRQALRSNRDIEQVSGFQWMGGIWEGEAIGFTGFWCLHDEPDRVGGIEVNFSELDDEERKQLAGMLDLPVRAGMGAPVLHSSFGHPKAEHRFVEDRVTYDFSVGSEWPYHLSCTVHQNDGLIHFSFIREDALERCTAK